MIDTHTTAQIPDEAVQAAAKHSYEYEGYRKDLLYVGWEYEGEEVREQWCSSVRQVLTAALPYISAPCVVTKPVDVAAVRRHAFEEGFENGVEQSLDALNAYDDITRNEAEQGIRKLKPDYRALSHELVSRSALEKGGR